MAIVILTRPRLFVYSNNASPALPVYSYVTAGWNPILYTFNVQDEDDLASTLDILIYEFGSNTQLAVFTVRPAKIGTFNVDVSTYVRAYMFNEYSADFAETNNRDDGGAIRFYIRYQQRFADGSQGQLFSDQSYLFTAVNAAMQFGDDDGGNMKRHVPFAFDLEESLKAKLLTGFDVPVKFAGYAMSLSFFYDNNLMGYYINKKQTSYDINNNELSENLTTLDPEQIRGVNYLKIDHPSESNSDSIVVSLHTGDPSNFYYVDPGYVDEGYHDVE